ncbi:hypothetical protein BDR07DRAFT_1459874 [Suillus spraguei]|nr:hypothetical protein BDR07DRAFT_1459874 [Suillus spraguei]
MGYNQPWDQGHPNEFQPSNQVSYEIAPSHAVEARLTWKSEGNVESVNEKYTWKKCIIKVRSGVQGNKASPSLFDGWALAALQQSRTVNNRRSTIAARVQSSASGPRPASSTLIDPNNSGITETVSLGDLMACRPRARIKADLAIKLLSHLQPSVCPSVHYPYIYRVTKLEVGNATNLSDGARQMRDAAMFVAPCPTLSVSSNLDKSKYNCWYYSGCDADEDTGDQTVAASFYSVKNIENCWLVVQLSMK